MTRLPPLAPAVAHTRSAVRRVLAELTSPSATTHDAADSGTGALVLVALSGGADSLSLAAATAFEAPKLGIRAGAIIIDHALQAGSAAVAARAAAQAANLGLSPVLVRTVTVDAAHADGPEAAARFARYAAIEQVCDEQGARAVLTAHTRDDQAEQVLLGIARGSGVRALSGIPPQRGRVHRPFLHITRAQTVAACEAHGLEAWSDPHNRDATYTRVRVRERVLPVIERELGAGSIANLARTAELARADADALDSIAADLVSETVCASEVARGTPTVELWVSALQAHPQAVRTRVLRTVFFRWIGVTLSLEHTLAVISLVTDWRGQGPIHVPGATVIRKHDRLVCAHTGARAARANSARLGG